MNLRFFDIARKLSLKSQYHHKLGAVVVKKGKVLGLGINNPFKTHPRSTNPFKTIHAELDAILSTDPSDLVGSDIYVYRQHKNGKPANAKPCSHCQELIKRSGIKRVFFTEDGCYKELDL